MRQTSRRALWGLSAAVILAIVSPALAQGPDFFFTYHEDALDDGSGARRVYQRLEREAAAACDAAAAKDQAVCQTAVVDRVVEQIDNDRFTRRHEKAGRAATVQTVAHFDFIFDEASLNTVNGTRRLYERLKAEAREFCGYDSRGKEDVDVCESSLVDRVVLGIDENALDRRHDRERRRSVYITDVE